MKTVIFDFDGVITTNSVMLFMADGVDLIVSEFPEVDRDAPLMLWSKNFLDFERTGELMNQTFGINLNIADFNAKMVDIYRKTSNRKAATPGIEKVLAGLDKYAIASSAQKKDIIKDVENLGLFEYFGENNVFSAYACEHLKPEPDVFIAACEAIGADVNNTWVIEDGVSNLSGAKRAGFKTFAYIGADHMMDKLWVTREMTAAGADVVSDDITEILKFV